MKKTENISSPAGKCVFLQKKKNQTSHRFTTSQGKSIQCQCCAQVNLCSGSTLLVSEMRISALLSQSWKGLKGESMCSNTQMAFSTATKLCIFSATSCHPSIQSSFSVHFCGYSVISAMKAYIFYEIYICTDLKRGCYMIDHR